MIKKLYGLLIILSICSLCISPTFAADGDPVLEGKTATGSIITTGAIAGATVFLTEQAAAGADQAGKGQIWVKTATPNELWFTDDAGTDVQLGTAAGGFDATGVDAVTWSDGANASNVWTFDVSGTDTTITFGNAGATFAGTWTATAFSGPLTGNVTGDVSGSSGSCTGQSATVATIAGLAPNTATTQATQASITSAANLATVGTITTGTWQATDVGVAYGGTGVSTLTDHGVLVGSGASAITALSVGATKTILKGITGDDPAFAVDRDFSKLDLTADTSISEAQIIANKYIANQGDDGEADLTLPAVSYVIGVIFLIEEAQNIEINPPSGEAFDLNGTTLDANDCVDSDSTVGSKIAATRMQIADGSWVWSLDTIRGAWVDTGGSD